MPSMQNILDTSTKLNPLDSYLRIVDFSKPFNSSKNIIDISTDEITTAIRLPDSIPRLFGGNLFISDGVMHMLPGGYTPVSTSDADGNENPTNKVWNFNLESRKWDIQVSGIKDNIESSASAFDTEKQVGWYYGGRSFSPAQNIGWTMSRGLYRLDKGNGAPTEAGGNSTTVGDMAGGELVYIKDVGKAGILVLIGGETDTMNAPMVSIGDQNYQFLPF